MMGQSTEVFGNSILAKGDKMAAEILAASIPAVASLATGLMGLSAQAERDRQAGMQSALQQELQARRGAIQTQMQGEQSALQNLIAAYRSALQAPGMGR